MRFISLLIVALALTLTWQSAILADIPGDYAANCADEAGMKDKKNSSGNEEPGCE